MTTSAWRVPRRVGSPDRDDFLRRACSNAYATAAGRVQGRRPRTSRVIGPFRRGGQTQRRFWSSGRSDRPGHLARRAQGPQEGAPSASRMHAATADRTMSANAPRGAGWGMSPARTRALRQDDHGSPQRGPGSQRAPEITLTAVMPSGSPRRAARRRARSRAIVAASSGVTKPRPWRKAHTREVRSRAVAPRRGSRPGGQRETCGSPADVDKVGHDGGARFHTRSGLANAVRSTLTGDPGRVRPPPERG